MANLSKKCLFCVALMTGISPTLPAQNNCKVYGRIKDEQNKPLASTTVTLINLSGRLATSFAASDSAGRFFLDSIPFGLFSCRITHSGYQALKIDSILLSSTRSNVSLDNLIMIPSEKILAEVTVSARSATIRSERDKKIFAVNQSLVSLGGSATDLLQNIPTLQIDANGNLSLRGATDLKVLVDGKRSLIGGGTVAQLLQSIPASSIERIEIISSPSARYDAEGLAIVNIILKKNNAAGFNSSFALTGGTRDNYNAVASISYQSNRINWYGNYSFQRQNKYSNGFQNMTYLLSPDSIYYSNETFPSVTITNIHAAKAGFDYTLSTKDQLSVSGTYNASSKMRNEWLTVANLMADLMPGQLSTRHNATGGRANNYEVAVDYAHTFRQPGKVLAFHFDYAQNFSNNLQTYNSYIYNINGNAADSTSVLQDNKIEHLKNFNIQLDYATTVGKAGQLEAGYRSQISPSNNQQWDYNLNKMSAIYIPDYSLIHFFKSANDVHACYISFRQQIKTFSLQVGIRAELGRYNVHLQSFDSSGQLGVQPITINTQALYPSLLFTKQLGATNHFQLSYARRILRPTARELDPYLDVSDPVNYDSGNPRLSPEDIHSVEITYTHSWATASISSGAYFTQVNNVIKHIQAPPVNDVTITISQNLKRAINTGLEFIGNFHPLNGWNFSANLNVFERFNAGDSAYGLSATQGLSWNINLTNNFTLAKNLTLQVRTDYKAADVIIQDRNHPAFGIDAGAKYELWHKKASLTLNGRDILNTRRWSFLRESQSLLLNFQRVTYTARLSITFSYRFGKNASNAKSRKEPLEEQDVRIENR